MSWNLILAWMAGISAVVGLGRAALGRVPGRGWVGIYAAILGALGAGMLWTPTLAGWIAASIWLPLVVLPSFVQRRISKLAAAHRFGEAEALSKLMVFLHPFDGTPAQPHFYAALGAAERGDKAAALAGMQRLASEASPYRDAARLHALRLEGRWREVASEGQNDGLGGLSFAVRAAGETGQTLEMFELTRRGLGSPQRSEMLLFAAALSGHPTAVEALFAGSLQSLPETVRLYWLATAEQTAGHRDRAADRLRQLSSHADPTARAAAERRLALPLPAVEQTSQLQAAWGPIDAAIREDSRWGPASDNRTDWPRATLSIGLALALNFARQIPGGVEDVGNLLRLGALILPLDLVADGWQRVATATLLHFGTAHFALNLVGLWILGSRVERRWGAKTVIGVWLCASLGANVIAALWLEATPQDPVLIVGASGGVMGLLGAALALVGAEWWQTRSAMIGRHLQTYALLLGVQMVFDAATPQVSSTVHVAGAVIGALCGFAIAIARRP